MTTGTWDLPIEQRTRLVALLRNPTYELIPLKGVLEASAALPESASVSVTASPSKDMAATVELAATLAARGFEVVPHLSAKMIRSRAELEWVIGECRAAGISAAFVIGGDVDEAGPYPDGLSLLEAMADVGHPFRRIGIPGYPEGHPFISDDSLQRALQDKEKYAAWVTTQMCFDDVALKTWIAEQRRSGVELPVVIGLPGVAEIRKLVSVAARIGVGDSKRFLSKHTRLIGRLVRPGGYAPDDLLTALGPLYTDPTAAVAGFHIYTFNQVETTEDWRRAFLDELTE